MSLLTRVLIKVHRAIAGEADNHVSIAAKQLYYVEHWAKAAVHEAAENETSIGKSLFLRLPEDVANILVTRPIDPFRLYLTEETVVNWLQRHILFNENGEVAVLHDNGKILWNDPNTNLKGLFDAV